MKVLQQIIAYQPGRGLLPKEQLVEMASRGILRRDEVYGEHEPESEEEPGPQEPAASASRTRPAPGTPSWPTACAAPGAM